MISASAEDLSGCYNPFCHQTRPTSAATACEDVQRRKDVRPHNARRNRQHEAEANV